ncbi:MAG TPA: hypothetical protein VF808_04940 [Ktedonobacterales bacterium]
MATRVGDAVEPRHIERLRLEIVEAIAAALAYPPFFDFRTGELRSRPIDRAKVAEIEQFIGSANFDAIARSSPSAPDSRRFLERLAQRYLEVNPALATPSGKRYLPLLRTRAAKLATETHRRFAGYVAGGERDFGARRQAASWSSSKRVSKRSSADSDRISRVLEAAIVPRDRGAPNAAPIYPSKSAPGATPSRPSGILNPPPRDIPAFVSPNQPPVRQDFAEQPTGPLASVAPSVRQPQNAQAPMRELPPDLLNLYGDYLGELGPEFRAPAQHPQPPPPPSPPRQHVKAPPPPETPTTPADARGDQLIFWQLRYQLEAYVRLAARSYGLPGHGGDPATVLDELRRSGFVDEADLRIAEGVFALTDRVTAQGAATTADYRQAMMLYLLYHRSHINA